MSESIVLVISGAGGLVLVAALRWWQRFLDPSNAVLATAGGDTSRAPRPPPAAAAERRALTGAGIRSRR